MERRNNAPAFKATHPGEILQLELEERGLTQKEFAVQIGMSPSHFNELLHGKRSITMAIADKLQEVLGIDSLSWMNLQTQYNYDIKSKPIETNKEIVTLQVAVENSSLLTDVKRAIMLLRGVRRVAVL